MVLLDVILLFLLCLTGQVVACPQNCYCGDGVMECVVEDCSTDFLLDTPVLILHGTLCDSQRFELKGMTDTQILLTDTLCYDLPDCR